jgi:hypothetical protein
MRIWTHRDDEYRGLRGWLHVGETTFSLELNRNKSGWLHASVTTGGEDTLKLSVAFPKVFAAWLGVELPFRRKTIFGSSRLARLIRASSVERETGVEISNWRLRFKLRVDPDGGTYNRLYAPRRTPLEVLKRVSRNRADERYTHPEVKPPLLQRWRYWGWGPESGAELDIQLDPRDRLLGRWQRLNKLGSGTQHAVVSMPEGNYPCRVKITRALFGRPKLRLGRRSLYTAEVDMDVPIPHPGKGENSWDCDDDATFSTTMGNVSSVAEAVSKVASHVLERRERYASLTWTPNAGWPEGVQRA